MTSARKPKVCLALVWHMHQPHYENPRTGRFQLPWVRLHGTKDYFDVAAAAEPFPRVRMTINVVPSLLEQIDDYVTGRRTDRYFELSRKAPADLDPAERRFIEENFFSANEATMIAPFPRYAELHRRIKEGTGKEAILSDSDLRDLMVLFNLVWIDPTFRREPQLKRLVDKGRSFTDEEKDFVLDRQIEILGAIVPLYRRLEEAGRIELSTSAYYHPILPLLLDSDSAREALPSLKLPRSRIQFPEDFDDQVRSALDRHESVFGVRPAGMWPPEGSVSDAAVRRLATHGVRWVASDEDVLARSQVVGGQPDPLDAYVIGADGREVAMVFRNKRISDLIGFGYMSWNPKEAAADFAAQVLSVAAGRRESGGARESRGGSHGTGEGDPPPLVSVILDGENCWEYYPEDGFAFQQELYGLLDAHPEIEMVTVGEYLRRYPPTRRIEHLFAGSWIEHNFAVWIGHPEDNAAWDLLARARTMVGQAAAALPPGDPAGRAARRHLAIAEGSDWFWWFGDDHWCAHIEVFDQLFRGHLVAAYEAVGLAPPSELWSAIKGRFGRAKSEEQLPIRFIHPRIDGRVTHFYEWKLAGRVDGGQGGGAMHPTETQLRGFYYGFNRTHLFVRVDLVAKFLSEQPPGRRLVVEISQPDRLRIEVDLSPPPGGEERPARLLRFDGDRFHAVPSAAVFAVDSIVEVAIPFADIMVKEGDVLELALHRMEDGRTVETLPARLPVSFRIPGSDFEAVMWSAS